MTDAEPVKRNQEIEEVTNLRVIHPIASRLVPLFAAWRISPNAVSLAGMLCGVLAGIAYAQYRNALFAVAGFLLMVMWHVMDGADGQLARLTRSQSQLGKFLDGICDYVTFTAVYVGLALALARQHGGWVWGLVAVAGACHAVQAAAYEVQRQDYEFWGCGRLSARLDLDALLSDRAAPSPGRQVAAALYRLYVRVQLLATGVDAQSRRALALTMQSPTGDIVAMRQCYRAIFAPGVRRWALMSANYRTLAIFLFSLAGRPLYYFGFEVVVLSGIMVALLAGQRPRYAAFFRAVAAVQPRP